MITIWAPLQNVCIPGEAEGGLQEEASRVPHCNIQDWSMSELYFHTGCRLEAHQRDNSYVPPHTLQMSVKAFKKPQVRCLCGVAQAGAEHGVLKANMTKHHILKPDVQYARADKTLKWHDFPASKFEISKTSPVSRESFPMTLFVPSYAPKQLCWHGLATGNKPYLCSVRTVYWLYKTDRKKLLGLSVVRVLTELGMHVSMR